MDQLICLSGCFGVSGWSARIFSLTSRAQARGVDDVVRDSGTGDAIPRCLQRFVRPHRVHNQLSISYPTKQPKTKCNSNANPQTPSSPIFYCDSQFVLVGWRSKSCHERDDAQNNKDGRNEHNENGVLRWRRLSRWWKNPKHIAMWSNDKSSATAPAAVVERKENQ